MSTQDDWIAADRANQAREDEACRVMRKQYDEVSAKIRAAVAAQGSTLDEGRNVDGTHVSLSIRPVAAKGTRHSTSFVRRFSDGVFAVRIEDRGTWRRTVAALPYAEIADKLIAQAAYLKREREEENARADKREAVREDPRFIALAGRLKALSLSSQASPTWGSTEIAGSGLIGIGLHGLTLDQAERVVAALVEVMP